MSKVWTKFKVLSLLDKFKKVKSIHCKHNLTILKGGTTTQYLRHLKGCVRRQMKLSGKKELTLKMSILDSETVALIQNFNYDQAKIR